MSVIISSRSATLTAGSASASRRASAQGEIGSYLEPMVGSQVNARDHFAYPGLRFRVHRYTPFALLAGGPVRSRGSRSGVRRDAFERRLASVGIRALIDCPFEFLSDCRDVWAAAPLDRDARTKCLIVHMLSCRMMNEGLREYTGRTRPDSHEGAQWRQINHDREYGGRG